MKPSVRWLDALALAVALVVTVRVLLAFAGRFDHPYDLEWMEGGMLAHAWRLQEGLGLYVEPNPDFIPYIYPPGYPALLAGLGALFGLEYPVGRAISIVGTLAAAGAIPFLCGRQLGQWGLGLAGGALYLGMFRASGGFFDLVRPDALGLAFVAWSVALGMERWRGSQVASGLLLCGAFLVKHNFALFGLPLLAGLWLRDGWPGASRFVAASAGPALLATLGVQVASGGHFLTYLLAVPRSHPMLWDRLSQGVPGELGVWLLGAALAASAWVVWRAQITSWPERLGVVGLALVAVVLVGTRERISGMEMGEPWVSAVVAGSVVAALAAALGAAARGVRERSVPVSWRVVLGAGVGGVALLLAGLMRAHHGGFINVLMPAHWVLALALPVVIAQLRSAATGPTWQPGVVVATSALLLAQLGWVAYKLDTDEVVPDDTQVAAGAAVEQALAETCPEGLIFSPQFAWLPTRIGRPPSMPLISLWDVADHPGGPYAASANRMMRAAVTGHHWACVLQTSRGLGHGFRREYVSEKLLSGVARELHPMTGWRVRPHEILVPR